MSALVCRRNILVVGLTFAIGLASTAAWAQDAAIGGLVTDTTGGVMPGVTVEARSPALIEGVRIAVTDGAGRYNIISLAPGTYAVTFTLPGFSTVLRVGVELTASFAAAINAEMAAGNVSETITVTGESPTVDVQRTTQQAVITDTLVSSLPTSSKSLSNITAIIPGIGGTMNVGGVAGLYSMSSAYTLTFHGKRDAKTNVDGMRANNAVLGSSTGYIASPGTIGEWALDTGGATAESTAAGVSVNYIPKDGGNNFSGEFTGLYSNGAMNANNLDAALMDGSWFTGTPNSGIALSTRNAVQYVYDSSLSVGGPLREDSLWFYTSHRFGGNKMDRAGIFFNKAPNFPGLPFPAAYEEDLSRPAYLNEHINSHAVRITWQASTNNKFTFFTDIQDNCICNGRGGNSDPLAAWEWGMWPQGVAQAKWTNTVSSRLLLEAAFGATISHWPEFEVQGSTPEHISIREASTGFRYNAKSSYGQPRDSDRYTQKFSLSYVTGSHSFKTGIYVEEALEKDGWVRHQSLAYTTFLGTPTSITQYISPYIAQDAIKPDLGIFAQDQWTVNRLTLNLGVRFDYIRGVVPAQEAQATIFIPARSFEAISGVPNFKDINPRLGAAYDLFGDGKTALKATFGRYLNALGSWSGPRTVNPITASITSSSRSWSDANGNFVPDCDLTSFQANGECGRLRNAEFGSPRVLTANDDRVRTGWGNRPFTWDLSVELQHELFEGFSVSTGYYRNWRGNFTVTDNLLVGPENYTSFCYTVPTDPNLPGGGGNQLCDLADINLDSLATDRLIRPAEDFGDHTRVADFFNLTVDGRLDSGVTFGGGVDFGRIVEDDCFIVDSPQDLHHCRVESPWGSQTQIKFHATVPLGYNIVVSTIFKSEPGNDYTANQSVSSAILAPALGRPLSAASRKTIALIRPETLFLDRRNQLDIRITKQQSVGGPMRLDISFDVYNLLNDNGVHSVSSTYGSRWGRPIASAYAGGAFLTARLAQLSANLSF